MLKALLLAAALIAQTGEYVEITVKQGDTLSKIASRYLQDPKAWPEMLQYNDIKDPNMIQPGRKLKVPLKMASETAKTEAIEEAKKSGPSESAWIAQGVQGKVEVNFAGKKSTLVKGGAVEPGSRVETAKDGGVDFKLPDTSSMRVGPNTKMDITKTEPASNKGQFKTLIKQFGGFLQARVAKLKGDASFEVHTPTAVAGVRGTEFSVEYDEVKGVSKTSVQEGKVAVAAEGKEIVVAQGEGTIVKKDEPPAPPIRLLSAPIMKKTMLADGNEALEWERPKGAQRCGFTISTTADFAATVKDTQSMEALAQEQGDLPPGDYYAAAYCEDANGLRGQRSEAIEFTIE